MFGLKRGQKFDEEDLLKILAILKRQQECMVKIYEIIDHMDYRLRIVEAFQKGQKLKNKLDKQLGMKRKK